MAQINTFGDANTGFQAGIINGSVNAIVNHAPLPLQTTPRLRPKIVIPFPRDEDYVERGDILDQVRHKCEGREGRAALVGFGGVGKSQLAIEYAYQTREQSPDTWVFWVYASNRTRFEQSFRDIADCIKLKGRKDPEADIFRIVHNWLRDSGQSWLIVLDNLDDARFLTKKRHVSIDEETQFLHEHLPYSDSGSILVTSRNTKAAETLVEQRNILKVSQMDQSEAVKLLQSKLRYQEHENDTAELVKALECMPLAISQAAAYITYHRPRCTARDYLDELQRNDKHTASLLDHAGGQLRRDPEAKNSIIQTWQVSFEHLREVRPSAANLLSLMSFFDRQGIPESLLYYAPGAVRPRPSAKIDSTSRSQSTSRLGRFFPKLHKGSKHKKPRPIQDSNRIGVRAREEPQEETSSLDEDIALLRSYCFVSLNSDNTTFEMHALIQLATRTWLAAHEQTERWRDQFVSNLLSAFPKHAKYEDWPMCRALFAHVKAAVEHQPDSRNALENWAELFCRAALYCHWAREDIDCKNFAELAADAYAEVYGQRSKEFFLLRTFLGRALIRTNQFDEAERIFTLNLEESEKIPGLTNLETVGVVYGLSKVYRKKGDLDKAINLGMQALTIARSEYTIDKEFTQSCMWSIAVTYGEQGRWEDAKSLQIEALDFCLKQYGKFHPETGTTFIELAKSWKNLGNLEEAIRLITEGENIRKEVYGSDHPYTNGVRARRMRWETELRNDRKETLPI